MLIVLIPLILLIFSTLSDPLLTMILIAVTILIITAADGGDDL